MGWCWIEDGSQVVTHSPPRRRRRPRLSMGRIYLAFLVSLMIMALPLGIAAPYIPGAGYVQQLALAAFVVLIIPGIYLLPTVIASARRDPDVWVIGIVNLVFGWTLVVWLFCLLDAVSGVGSRD